MANRGSGSASRPSSPDRVVSLPTPELDDGELLRQVLEARPAALRELYDRHAPLVRQVMVRMIGPDSEVDDLVQDALMVFVQRASTIRDPSALRSFIYSIALRVARNEVRKRAIRKWLPWLDEAAPAVAAPHDIVSADLLRRVYGVLDHLGADLRVAFVLRFVEGHEHTEAAVLAGCSLATFKRRVRKAQERFDRLAARDAALSEWFAKKGARS